MKLKTKNNKKFKKMKNNKAGSVKTSQKTNSLNCVGKGAF